MNKEHAAEMISEDELTADELESLQQDIRVTSRLENKEFTADELKPLQHNIRVASQLVNITLMQMLLLLHRQQVTTRLK